MTGENRHVSNAIRNWKGIQLNYDVAIDNASTNFALYCLSDTQAEALRALIMVQAWKTRWFSPENATIDIDKIDSFTSEVITRLMDGCGCGEATPPPRFRFTADGGYEISTDNGTTWQTAPEWDYRLNSILSPSLVDQGISNTKCQAADGVIIQYRDNITNSLEEGQGAAAILALIAAVLLVFLTAGSALVIASMPGIAGAILSVGVVAFQAAFTEEVWETFRCLVYCRMDSDDSIDEEGWRDLIQDVHDNFEGIVNIHLTNLLNGTGAIGLTNMMRSAQGDPEADCSECECNEGCGYNYNVYGLYGSLVTRTETSITVEAVLDANVGGYGAGIKAINMENCCVVDVVAISGTITNFNSGWAACGEDATYPSFPNNSVHISGCDSMHTRYSTVPFTARFDLLPCEEE